MGLPKSNNYRKRVAIIGAGSSGLAAIKCCLDEGMDPICFEQDDDIGGLWRYSETPLKDKGGTYKSCVINSSKSMMSYSDFPIPDDFPPFMPHSDVLKYLHMYMEHFNLRRYIRFGVKVVTITPRIFANDEESPRKKWIVISRCVKDEGDEHDKEDVDYINTVNEYDHREDYSHYGEQNYSDEDDEHAQEANKLNNQHHDENEDYNDFTEDEDDYDDHHDVRNIEHEGIQELHDEDSEQKGFKKEVFDAVMVCTGHHVYPNRPSFPGLESFHGTVLHSKEYKTPDAMKDKTVLIVGE